MCFVRGCVAKKCHLHNVNECEYKNRLSGASMGILWQFKFYNRVKLYHSQMADHLTFADNEFLVNFLFEECAYKRTRYL